MQVSLTVSERIALGSSVLPSESNFITLKLVRDLKKHIGFTEQELATFNLKDEMLPSGQTRFTWDRTKETEAVFEFSDKAVEVIKRGLTAIADKEQANDQHLTLWEKFSKE